MLNVAKPSEAAQRVRDACRSGKLTGPTAGMAMGCAQANLVILPKANAYDFLLFCQRNPKPCPLLDVTDVGSATPTAAVCHPDSKADLRTDLPRYCLYRDGKLVDDSLTDLKAVWRDDFVCFLLGCSFSFEEALLNAGLGVRHLDDHDGDDNKQDDSSCKNVPMYRTNVQCRSAGEFHGPLVVSMRPYTPADAIRAVEVTSRYPRVHGSPVHIGSPSAIGIADIAKPDYGDAITIRDGEVPVFWACGVTPQAVAVASKPPLMITHAPGCMFVCDINNSQLAS